MALHIQQIACGQEHSLILLSDGSVWATGYNYDGQLGDGATVNKSTWTSVIPSGVIQVAAGQSHSFALKSDGALWVTGANHYGQLGDGTFEDKSAWTSVIASGVTQVAAGAHHSLALKSDGSVWATGQNYFGQLGDGTSHGTSPGKSTWTSVMSSGSDVVQVMAGDSHSLVLKSDGSVWAAGNNSSGGLGDGTTTNKSTWTSVIPSGVTQVGASGWHSLAVKSDGSVWATGFNVHGQLGDGTYHNKSTWISVMPSGSGVIQLAAGHGHSLALKSDGSLWATGANDYGQFGNGREASQSTWAPVRVSSVNQVVGGGIHSFALKRDGTLWKTGDNHYGQLGQEGAGSTVWIPDPFFEKLLLESLMGDPGSMPDRMPDPADDWPGLSL